VTAPKEAVFQCSVELGQPAAKVRCFRSGRELVDSSKYSTVVRGNEVRLVVRDTELTDEGKYRCELSNKLGTVDTEARLIMKSTLKLTSCPKSVADLEGAEPAPSILLICDNGTVLWRHHRRFISSNT